MRTVLKGINSNHWHPKYTKSNTTMSRVNEMELDERVNPYGLSPAELSECNKRVIDIKNGKYMQELNSMFPRRYKDMDGNTKYLFTQSLYQLEIINISAANLKKGEMELFDNEKAKLDIGDSFQKTFEYRDVNGNDKKIELGIERQEMIPLSEEDRDARTILEPKANYRYFEMAYDPNLQTEVKNYISEADFNKKLGDYCRNKQKEQNGIGEEIFCMRADDGSRFIITDARDDDYKDPITGKTANSFDDGFKEINMYRIAPDGTKTQMTKDDVEDMIKQNGIDINDIDARETHGKGTSYEEKRLRQETRENAARLKNEIEGFARNNHGMDATTSTRA